MIRWMLIACGLLLAGAGAVQLHGETQYVLRARRPVAALLGTQGPAVIFVFQPEDCLSNGELVKRWNALHESRAVDVRGRVVGRGLSGRQQTLFARNDVRIPLRPVPVRDAAIVAETLGYTSTPFAVILDRHGRVAGSFPAHQNVPPEILRKIALPP